MNRTEPDDPTLARLAQAHDAVNARHDQSRAALVESISTAERAPTGDRGSSSIVPRRVLLGGLGMGAAAAAIALAMWFVGSTSPALAMEQMAKALDRVSGYTYRMEKNYVSRNGQGRTVRHVTVGRWRTTPTGLYAKMQIVEMLGTNAATADAPKLLVDLEEAHQAGRLGILVDHLKHAYWRVNEPINAAAIPSDSPQVAVYMVQQRRGRVLQDLGTKDINGRPARGLEIGLDNSQPVSELGDTSPGSEEEQAAGLDWRNMKFEVWIDPQTDLPIEFRCARRGDDFETTYFFTDLQWNVDFAADAFDVAIPEGYTEREMLPADDGE